MNIPRCFDIQDHESNCENASTEAYRKGDMKKNLNTEEGTPNWLNQIFVDKNNPLLRWKGFVTRKVEYHL
jgi:hypothetical protein